MHNPILALLTDRISIPEITFHFSAHAIMLIFQYLTYWFRDFIELQFLCNVKVVCIDCH